MPDEQSPFPDETVIPEFHEPPVPPPPKYVPDGLILEKDLPGGNWVVFRKSLTRAKAQELRDRLWAVGIFPGASTATFTSEQWHVWEEDWALRIVAFTKAWSIVEPDEQLTTFGHVLPIVRESIDKMPDRVYQAVCRAIGSIPTRSDEDAKSPGVDSERLGQGAQSGNGDASAVPNGISGAPSLVDESRPPMAD